MSTFDAFRHDGTHARVIGGTTGMGAAADLLLPGAGAEAVLMDLAEASRPGAKAVSVNLAERESVDAAVAVNGQTIVPDRRYLPAGLTGAFPYAAGVAPSLAGRAG